MTGKITIIIHTGIHQLYKKNENKILKIKNNIFCPLFLKIKMPLEIFFIATTICRAFMQKLVLKFNTKVQ